MITESELAAKVQEILQSSDLKKTTNNSVIKQLEDNFGFDLSDKKPFLRYQVDRFLQSRYEEDEDEDGGDVIGRERAGYGHVFDSNDDDDDNDGDDDDYDDGFYDGVPEVTAPVRISSSSNNNFPKNNNEVGKLKGVDKLDRRARQNKEKVKRICLSGKYCTLSPELQKFIGASQMTRTEIVRHLWTYVKDRRLQDPSDGKTIICDDTLRVLFGVDSINILQINKALTKHIWPQVKRLKRDKLRKQEKEVKSLPKDKPLKQEREEDPCGAEMKEIPQKKVLSGFLAPLPLSDTLIRFLGTEEIALTRAVVIRRVWEYIKRKKLQDPSNRKTIICDEKLKELFNVDAFDGFTVSKLLTPHFVKLSGLPSIKRQIIV